MGKVINLTEGQLAGMIGRAMKRLVIRENMEAEGGNAISQAEPIRGDIAGRIGNELAGQIQDGLKVRANVMGSTGKKGPDQTSGDIDIGVELPWEKMDVLKKYLERLYGKLETYTSPGFKTFGIGYPYTDEDGNEKIVQVDFMFSRNVEYCSFVHHSPNYLNNESQFKGAMRMILLKNIIGKTPLDPSRFRDETYGPEDFGGGHEGEKKSWWKYTLDNDEGLEIVHRTNQGVRKPLKTSKRIPQDTIRISEDIGEIIRMTLGDSATLQDTNSWESLVDFLFSGRYRYDSPEMLQKIFHYFFRDRNVCADPDIYRSMYDYVERKMQERGMSLKDDTEAETLV